METPHCYQADLFAVHSFNIADTCLVEDAQNSWQSSLPIDEGIKKSQHNAQQKSFTDGGMVFERIDGTKRSCDAKIALLLYETGHINKYCLIHCLCDLDARYT